MGTRSAAGSRHAVQAVQRCLRERRGRHAITDSDVPGVVRKVEVARVTRGRRWASTGRCRRRSDRAMPDYAPVPRALPCEGSLGLATRSSVSEIRAERSIDTAA